MKIAMSQQFGTKVVSIIGRIQHPDCQKLQEAFGTLVAGEKPNIAADLSQVSYLDSSALGIFVSTLKSAKSRGGDLRLAGLAGVVMDVFTMTRLSSVFQIHPTIDQAVHSFSGK